MNEVTHLENVDNKGHTVCGEVLNEDTISYVEILCTCEKCKNALIYINFGDMARHKMNMQCQYASRYVDGVIDGWKNLGEGLRFKGNTNVYHSLRIHKDDVEEFVQRYNDYMKEVRESI